MPPNPSSNPTRGRSTESVRENPNNIAMPPEKIVETSSAVERDPPESTSAVEFGRQRIFDESGLRSALPPGGEVFVSVPLDPPMPRNDYAVMSGTSVADFDGELNSSPRSYVVRRFVDRVIVAVFNEDDTRFTPTFLLTVSVMRVEGS